MKQGVSHSNVWQLFNDEVVGNPDDYNAGASLDLSYLEDNASQKEDQPLSIPEEPESTTRLSRQADLPEPIYVSEELNQEAQEKDSIKEVPPSLEKTCCAQTEKKLEILMAIHQELILSQSKTIQSLLADNMQKAKKIVSLTQLLDNSNVLLLACNQNFEKALQANAALLSKLSELKQTTQVPMLYPVMQSYIPTFALKTGGQSQATETSTPQQRPSNS